MSLRWGIAGCGWVARDYVAPAIGASRNGVLAACYDVLPDAREAMARLAPQARMFAGLPEFLAGIDALYVATPNHAHAPLVLAAASAGLPVLCEKPMAASLEEARAMVASCAQAGVLYGTAFDQRFHAAHRHMARLVRDGALGTVSAIRIAYCCWVDGGFQADNWRVDPARAGGGALMDLAPHGLDLASCLLGERLTDIAAMGQSRVHDYPVEDGALLMARSQGGALVQLHVAYNCPEGFPRRRLEVVGTRAMLTAEDTMGQTPGGRLTMTAASDGVARVLDVPDADASPFQRQVEAFADAVARRTPFVASPAHDLHIMELVARAQDQVRAQLAHSVATGWHHAA